MKLVELLIKAALGPIRAARFFTIPYHYDTAYIYSISLKRGVNRLMDRDNLSATLARIQFIADVSLVAHCKEDELKNGSVDDK